MNRKLMIMLITVLFLSACSSKKTGPKVETKTNAPDCVDFLAKWKMSDPHIKYKECTIEPANQEQPKLFATYEVEGKDAKSVESYLMKKFGMKKLVFECCGWAPLAKNKDMIPLNNLGKGTYQDQQYINPFLIYLTSGETTAKNWNKIQFKVVIETNYTEI